MAKTTTGGRGGTGTRGLHTKIKKKAGTIKESSRRWLERHINDPSSKIELKLSCSRMVGDQNIFLERVHYEHWNSKVV